MRSHLVLFCLLFNTSLLAQQQSNRGRQLQAYSTLAQPRTDRASSLFVTDPMPLVAPVFVEDHDTSSVLVLVNNSSDRAGGTLHMRNLAGAEVFQSRFILKPHEERDIPVSTLHSAVAVPQYGSIELLPDKDLKGPSLAGQLLITDNSNSVPAYLDEELAMPSMQGSSVLRAVTDDSVGLPLVAISNLSQQPQTAIIRCLSADKQEAVTAINLPAHSTSVRLACSDDAFTGLAAYLSAKVSGTNGRVTGIEITGDGVAGEIAAFAFAPHKRNSDIVFSSVPFSDPATIHSPDFIFAGVPIGPQPTLPNGVYVPRVSLSNFSAKSAQVSVLLSSTPLATEANGTGTARPATLITSITIPPRQTREVLLTGNEAQSGLQNSITVTSDLQPGDVVGKLVSRSDGNLYQIELLAKDKLDIENGGIHPWSIEGDTESHLILHNHSSRPQKFDVALSNGEVLWDKTYWINPNETREINFNQLLRDHVPDDRKRTLPETVRKGVVNWVTPDGGNATGRLMVTSRAKVMARNYSCGNFVVPCQGNFYTVSNFIGVGQAAALFSLGVNFCNSYYPGQCSGNNQGSGSANYYSTSGTQSAIGFNDSDQPYLQEPVMVGVGPGSSGFTETASANSCSVSGYGSGSVDTTADSLPPENSVSDSVDGTLNIDCDSGSCTAASSNTGETSQPVPVHGFPTYGNYCGAGGSGTPIDTTDAACQAHDTCFGNYGIDFNSYRSGNLTQAQIQGAGMCNVNLCNSIRNVNSSSSIPFQQRAAGAIITLVFTFVGPAAAQCNP